MYLMILGVVSGREGRVDAVTVLTASFAVIRGNRWFEHDAAALAVMLRLLRVRVVAGVVMVVVMMLWLLRAVDENRRHRRRL